jgi:ribosomal-protein-alanine N-acetyltransferase
MIDYTIYRKPSSLSLALEQAIVDFLFHHLENYGDPKSDIQKCIDYALGREWKPGGIIIVATEGVTIVGATVINFTGMEGYIPQNILVYIATHNQYRGKGIGKSLMKMAIEKTEGNIALHVEPDNPAKNLYERMGFTNKYLEMRLNK